MRTKFGFTHVHLAPSIGLCFKHYPLGHPGNYTSAEYHYKEAYKLDSSPPVLLDNMRKLQRRLFTVQENTCWRTDTSCTDSSVIL
ncbi:uncharacterized protein TNCT_332411 [Trichonephila clavata]|uniref:Uncharacterized protein n=1 Tax=Trichonephila clavata TaxID=2740835 RepID=A0A8X6GAI9_TRICU|nr:uncharacterized protein TNCT_332411 [Trichonephila clavata]